MKALSISGLTKTYANGFQALRGLDLDVEEGDFFALLGPNGAGKTTMIGIITSLVSKTAGTVEVFGHDIDRELEVAKSCIGLVPQEINFNLFDRVQNIVINQAGYYGIPRRRATERAEFYLRKLKLWDKRNERARNLSGGMKRRLMIARALVHDPRLLILDEPTAGVDIEIRRSMWEFLREINTAGTTIILTTHYLEEAETLCRHIAIIDDGRIIERDRMSNILRKLHVETFVLNLAEPQAREASAALAGFEVRVVDETTIEIDIFQDQGYCLNDIFAALGGRGIRVPSMRNKVNRLEELFLRLVEGGSPGGARPASARTAAAADGPARDAVEGAAGDGRRSAAGVAPDVLGGARRAGRLPSNRCQERRTTMSVASNYVGYMTIVRKEYGRIMRIWVQTIVPPVITVSMYFIIFGTLIGERIGPMAGFDYMQYIAPGLIMMSVINNSFGNVVSSFFGAKFGKHIEEMLVSPMPNWLIILGHVTGGVIRGLLVGLLVTVIALFFTELQVTNLLVTVSVVLLTAVVFSLGGLINAIFARDFEGISIIPTFVLAPLTYLGGVFYSIDLLPSPWQELSRLNPILYMVNAFRYGILGASDVNIVTSFSIIVGFGVVLYAFAIYLMRRGTGMRS